MPRNLQSSLLKPLVALATPGIYLFYKFHQFKRQQEEQSRRKVTERELTQLNHKIDKLLAKLDEHEPELAATQEEECVVCISAKASMQTYPCGHKVVCRKCFVKTIQMAVSQRLLPLRCVICRTKILRLKQSGGGGGSSSASTTTGRLSHSSSHSSQLTSCSLSTYAATSSSSSSSTSSSSSCGLHQRHLHQPPPLRYERQRRRGGGKKSLAFEEVVEEEEEDDDEEDDDDDVRAEAPQLFLKPPPPPVVATTTTTTTKVNWKKSAYKRVTAIRSTRSNFKQMKNIDLLPLVRENQYSFM